MIQQLPAVQKGKTNSNSCEAKYFVHELLPFLNLVVFSVSEEVFVKSSEEDQQHRETGDQTHEEVQRRMREVERERKRRDVMEKLKRLSISSGDPEEPFSPLSPRSPSYMVSMASS